VASKNRAGAIQRARGRTGIFCDLRPDAKSARALHRTDRTPALRQPGRLDVLSTSFTTKYDEETVTGFIRDMAGLQYPAARLPFDWFFG